MSDLVREYATALFTLTEEDGVTDAVLADIAVLREALEASPDFIRILTSPNLSLPDKHKCLQRTFGEAHVHLFHFLCLLTDRGYAREIPACLAAYADMYRSARGIKIAKVESATPLTEEEQARLIQTLSRRYACEVELEQHVDTSLLGGVRVTIDGNLQDGTVRGRLHRLKKRLAETVL